MVARRAWTQAEQENRMRRAPPSRFRDPLHDPDPTLAKHYRAAFGRGVPSVLAGQVELLAQSLAHGDALADAWIAWTRDIPRERARALLEAALADGVDAVVDAPPPLRALFAQVEAVPLWVDLDKLALGARTFRRTGVLGQLVLADFGLMAGYGSGAVVKPLVMTGQLEHNAAERLIHTGRFVTAVTDAGALARGSDGYRAAVRVRLVHAAIRASLAQSSKWNRDAWGVPINQADMLATNLLFSIGLIEGCRKLGLRFREREVDAVVHLWRYAGYLLGLDEALLPSDGASAMRALYLVGVSQPPPDEDSRSLAAALHRLPLTFAKSPLAARLLRVEMGVRVSFTRRMIGEETADALGLPRSALRHAIPAIVGLVRGFEFAREHVPLADELSYRLADRAVKGLQTRLDRELTRARVGRGRARPTQ